MKGNRYVQSRIFLKALIINWFFKKMKPEGAEATEGKQEILNMCKGSILHIFLKD